MKNLIYAVTYKGPNDMAKVLIYPLERPMAVMRTMGYASSIKGTDKWFLGWALHNIKRGMNAIRRKDKVSSKPGLFGPG